MTIIAISPATTGDSVLERELGTFARLLPVLLDAAEGRWVLIKGNQLLGLFASQNEAINAGYAQLGNQPFLTRQLREAQMVAIFSRDLLISAYGID